MADQLAATRVMADQRTAPVGEGSDRDPRPEADDAVDVEDELLVEEISIDGMCGVY